MQMCKQLKDASAKHKYWVRLQKAYFANKSS